MGKRKVKIDYEELRKAQILENQARLASHGIQKTITDLRTITGKPKPQSDKKKHNKIDSSFASLRRSNRFKEGESKDNNKLAVKKSRVAKRPKRPLCAYFIFMEEFREEYKEKHSNNKSVAVVGKAAGEKWKSFSDTEKAPYQAKTEEMKAEYLKKMRDYKNKQQAGVVEEEEDDDKSRFSRIVYPDVMFDSIPQLKFSDGSMLALVDATKINKEEEPQTCRFNALSYELAVGAEPNSNQIEANDMTSEKVRISLVANHSALS
ncbi:hypothetical protein K7X08_024180 [Anisodus acutangulus]|uniref:HMG box domain-containing protein n=1 Tax=Anisodus acutangulus TaxID=402998 RepID=A0A9Q1MB30_9SOLA|nr:hypothetical protein K7X08_024180 [Anisodus acutangulus]